MVGSGLARVLAVSALLGASLANGQDAAPEASPDAGLEAAPEAAPDAAQESAPDPSLPSSAFRSVEEIVVTAQKRTQNVQDVPISIVAFPGQALVDLGITDTQQLQMVNRASSTGRTLGTRRPTSAVSARTQRCRPRIRRSPRTSTASTTR